jgi:hypothetical protein
MRSKLLSTVGHQESCRVSAIVAAVSVAVLGACAVEPDLGSAAAGDGTDGAADLGETEGQVAGDRAEPPVAADEEQPDDGPTSAPAPALSSYCQAQAAHMAKCAPKLDCNVATACPGLEKNINDDYKVAEAACMTEIGCDPGRSVTECTYQAVANEPRTAAQTKLAADYCAACGAEIGPGCTTKIWQFPDTSKGETLTAVAYFGRLLADPILAQLVTECVATLSPPATAGKSCDDQFGYCARALSEGMTHRYSCKAK